MIQVNVKTYPISPATGTPEETKREVAARREAPPRPHPFRPANRKIFHQPALFAGLVRE